MLVFEPLLYVPVPVVVPPVVVPVVPVEPEPVVELVVCAFALRAIPATSIQPITITFFIVELNFRVKVKRVSLIVIMITLHKSNCYVNLSI